MPFFLIFLPFLINKAPLYSYFIQLLLMYFIHSFWPCALLLHVCFLCIFPPSICADSFCVMERGIIWKSLQLLVGLVVPNVSSSQTLLVHLSSLSLLWCMRTCSLNFEYPRASNIFEETGSIVSLLSCLTCHLPRLVGWVIVKWKWCCWCEYFSCVSPAILWFLEGYFLILPKGDRGSRATRSNQRLCDKAIMTAEFDSVSEFLHLF